MNYVKKGRDNRTENYRTGPNHAIYNQKTSKRSTKPSSTV